MSSERKILSRPEAYAHLIQRAKDPEFKQALKNDTRKTIEAEFGFSIPESVEFVVVEDTPTRIHVVLPTSPLEMADGELDERALEMVAGGSGSHVASKVGFNFTPSVNIQLIP